MSRPKGYADLASLPEDERIRLIGTAVERGQRVAVGLETDKPEKIKRYIEKVTTRHRAVCLGQHVLGTGDLATVTIVSFGPVPS